VHAVVVPLAVHGIGSKRVDKVFLHIDLLVVKESGKKGFEYAVFLDDKGEVNE